MDLYLIKLDDGSYTLQRSAFWRNPDTKVYFGAPKGFVTDFVSTKILKFSSKCDVAALFHDVDYWYQEKPRSLADKHYRQNLRYFGVNYFVATAQYLALRSFGWLAWRKNKKLAEKHGLNSKILLKNG